MLSDEQAKAIKKNLFEQLKKFPAEQAAEIREQIEDASPEELEEFLKAQKSAQSGGGSGTGNECIFCQIISGKIETTRIYEDADVICILDVNPASRGHALVMPKEHFQFINEIPDALLNKIFIFVKAIEPVMIETLKAQGMSIYIGQGELAGQRVPHFCINMIPRYKDDKLSFEWERQKIDKKELEKTAEELRKKASKEVKSKIESEVKKEHEKKKVEDESEAEKIYRHVKRRMP